MQNFDNESDFIQFIEQELITTNLNANTAFRNISVWSSLNALILVSRIHEETGVIISSRDLANMETISDIYQFINKTANGVG